MFDRHNTAAKNIDVFKYQHQPHKTNQLLFNYINIKTFKQVTLDNKMYILFVRIKLFKLLKVLK